MAENADAKVKNALILYLTQNGFTDTAKVLKNERKSFVLGQNSKRRKISTHLNESEDSFEKLLLWIQNSLDIFKPQYRTISLVCFIYIYINLVSENQISRAMNFLNQYKQLFLAEYPQEIHCLATINSPSHIPNISRSCKYAIIKVFLRRMEITMSEMAFELLINFMFDSGLMTIMQIINENLSIKCVKSLHALKEDSNLELVNRILQEAGRGRSTEKLPRIAWGIPYELEMLYASARYSKDLLRVKLQHVYPSLFKTRTIAAKIRSIKPGSKVSDESIEASSHYVNIYAPKSDSEFFAPIQAHLINKLLVSESTILSKAAAIPHTGKRAVQSANGWPSISMGMLFDVRDATCAESSHDGAVIALGTSKGRMTVFNTVNDVRTKTYRTEREDLVAHSAPIYSTRISRDKKKVLSCSADGYTRLWVNMDPSFVHNMELVSAHAVQQSNFSKDSIKKWCNVQSFKPRSLFATPSIWNASFCPLGHYFSTCSNVVRLFSIEHEQEFTTLDYHSDEINAAIFHPNMHYVFSAGSDKLINMYDLRTQEPVRRMKGHLDSVRSIETDASGKYLISTGDDNLVMVWDIANSTVFKAFHSGSLSSGKQSHLVTSTCSLTGEHFAFATSDGFISMVDTKYLWGTHASPRQDLEVIATLEEIFDKECAVSVTERKDLIRTYKAKCSSLLSMKFLNEKIVYALAAD